MVTFPGTLSNISKNLCHFSNHPTGERLIIIGQRGIGKTTTLYSAKKKLDENGIKNFFFTHLFEDAAHFQKLAGESISSALQNPVYLLIDFPDEVETAQFKSLLSFVWDCISGPYCKNVNFLFAMNHSHYSKSFSFSEILGKFMTFRLEPFSQEETLELISCRLDKIGTKVNEIFPVDVLEMIYAYSRGIPRNIITACNLLFDASYKGGCTSSIAHKILNENYFEYTIKDRVSDGQLRRDYLILLRILRDDFKGATSSKMEYISKCQEATGMGRMMIHKMIEELINFGVMFEERTGEKRISKMISLTPL